MSNRLLLVDPSDCFGGNCFFGSFAHLPPPPPLSLRFTKVETRVTGEGLFEAEPNLCFIVLVLQSALSEMDSIWTLCPSWRDVYLEEVPLKEIEKSGQGPTLGVCFSEVIAKKEFTVDSVLYQLRAVSDFCSPFRRVAEG